MSLSSEKRSALRFDIRAFLSGDIGRAAKRYLFVGGGSALADWVLFALFLYGFGLHYIISGAISFILATGLNYHLSVKFVFGAGSRGARQAMMLVYLVSGVGIAMNLGVLTVGIDYLALHPLLSKFIATGVAVFWNFTVRYFYIFR